MKYFLIFLIIGLIFIFLYYICQYKDREPIRLGDLLLFPIMVLFWPIFVLWHIWEVYELQMNQIIFLRPSKEELERDVKNLKDS